jgi:hypothetical protein
MCDYNKKTIPFYIFVDEMVEVPFDYFISEVSVDFLSDEIVKN